MQPGTSASRRSRSQVKSEKRRMTEKCECANMRRFVTVVTCTRARGAKRVSTAAAQREHASRCAPCR